MRTSVLVGLYLFAIVAANLLISIYGPALSIPVVFIFIGLDLTARDTLHDRWKHQHLFPKMAGLILTGSALSALISIQALPIAIASFVAFALAGLTDMLTYSVLGEKERLIRINGSNIVSAFVDSVVFQVLAFGFPLAVGLLVGQYLAKVIGGGVWSFILTPAPQHNPARR